MAVFRTSEHTPDVYSRKSRDFQLFCAILDMLFGALKYNINSIRDITDTSQCNERLLPYLQTKLGFYTNLKISGEDLRLILRAFPTIVHNKGSRIGIEQAIQVFLKLQGLDANSEVKITNYIENDAENSYVVNISITSKLTDTSVLTEILKYVLPAGYKLKYSFLIGGDTTNNIHYKDSVTIVNTQQVLSSGLRPANDATENYDKLISRVDTGMLVENSNVRKEKNVIIPDLTKIKPKELWNKTTLD